MASPIRTARIHVSHIIESMDMRYIHTVRDSNKVRNLSPGSCVLALNKSQRIARFIDYLGGVHTYYAEEDGPPFDLPAIRSLVKDALYVDLTPDTQANKKVKKLWAA